MFKSIHVYDDAAALIHDFRPEIESCYEMAVFDGISHVNDFETMQFLVIDGSDGVIFDSLNGDVYDKMSIDSFIQETINYAIDELD